MGEESFAWPFGDPKEEVTSVGDGPAFYVAAAVLGDADSLVWEVQEGRRLVLHIAPSAERRTIQILRQSGSGSASLAAFGKFAIAARKEWA